MLYNRLPGLNISALASLALISPIVVNPSGCVGSGAPNRLEVQTVQFLQITLHKQAFPQCAGWVACYECSDSVVNCMFTAGSLTVR